MKTKSDIVTSDDEIQKKTRFAFGKNWQQYLLNLKEHQIQEAEKSLQTMLGVETLRGKTFLDIGSGSGLFSLAARRLGAQVRSFDYDATSVWCTRELRRRFFDGDDNWVVERGNVLSGEYLQTLGQFDVVYSWGVLHHTGDMWKAFESVVGLVRPKGGKLFIAIYNDEGRVSVRWRKIKQFYCRSPRFVRFLIAVVFTLRSWWRSWVKDLLTTGNPLSQWNQYYQRRGMSVWWDIVDWVGGYPFEVSNVERIMDFYRARGFMLVKLKTDCGRGNNEFVFEHV